MVCATIHPKTMDGQSAVQPFDVIISLNLAIIAILVRCS